MNIFQSVKVPKVRRNVFDLSHEHKLTLNMGKLVPFLCLDVLPHQSIRCYTEAFLRFMPLYSPVMHRINVYTHFFFVPNRLVEHNWEDFITGGEDGKYQGQCTFINFNGRTSDNTSYGNNPLDIGFLADYLGYKTTQTFNQFNTAVVNGDYIASAQPFLAYNLIWNEYYRDQNLQEPFPIDEFLEEFGGTTIPWQDLLEKYNELFLVRNRCWEKDYFTSALPWPQRGDQMTLPISGLAPIEYNGDGFTQLDFKSASGLANVPDGRGGIFLGIGKTGRPAVDNLSSGPFNISANIYGPDIVPDSSTSQNYSAFANNAQGYVNIDNSEQLSADLSGATAVTINELRRVMAIQRWLEANARGGSRYVEQLLMHFGIKPQDARLQRPEFLGGGKSPVVVSEVLQTSASDAVSPQGNMAGKALSGQSEHSFTYTAQEHGWVIGIMSVMPRTGYHQGLPRKFTRHDKFDYAWPELAHLGEQEILKKELVAGVEDGDVLFGYTPRYAEYKFHNDVVSGDFRTNLNYWHLSRNLGINAALNSEFVEADVSDRIFPVNDNNATDKLLADIYMNIRTISPLPKYGTPI